LNKFVKFLGIIITLLFIALFICAILQVFSRYLLPYSITWTEEVARFLLIYITFIGAAVAIYEKTHISITTFVNKLSARIKLIVQIIMNFVILFFLYLVFRGGINMTLLTWGVVSGSMLKVMTGYVYIIIPISAFLMMIFSGKNIIDNFMAIKKLNKQRI